MTTVNFTPAPTSPFQFPVILDGNAYTIIIPWVMFGKRYYLSVYDSNGNLVISQAMVGSTNDYLVNLIAGAFKISTVGFYPQANQIVILP